VAIQLATALLAFLLVQLFKMATNDHRKLQLVLVWVRHNLPAKLILNGHSPPIYQFLPLSSINKGAVLL
ncbi:hypothetical protein ABTF50_20800, partial [Acinetobacter baumannii]